MKENLHPDFVTVHTQNQLFKKEGFLLGRITVLLLLSLCLFAGCDNSKTNEEPSDAAWWGEYSFDTAYLGIGNYNGHSFQFFFNIDNGETFEGVAAVYEDNVFQAEYMDLIFTLSNDSEIVTITQGENREDKEERAVFVGTYQRKADDTETSSTDENNTAFSEFDYRIENAVSIINESKQDSYSDTMYGYEKRLARDVLSAENQILYNEVLANIENFETITYTAEQYGYDFLDNLMVVCGAIAIDWPELENYFVIDEIVEDSVTLALQLKYFMPSDADIQTADTNMLQEELSLFDTICERIIMNMPENISTYDKYRYIATVISLSTNYDYDGIGGWQDSTAYGAIISGYSICQGYSRAFMALCEKADLWCVCVDGEVNGIAHMWNKVRLDTGYYHIDVTWSDEQGSPDSPGWHKYFMLTDDEISADHNIVGETLDIYSNRF